MIETVNDGLKNIVRIECSRHCSFSNFNANLLPAIVAYYFLKYNVNLLMMDDFLFFDFISNLHKVKKNRFDSCKKRLSVSVCHFGCA